jgi:hypothetical protein
MCAVDDWAAIRTVDDLEISPPTEKAEIEAAEVRVGLPFPPALVSMYRFCNGLYQPGGHLWVVWQLSELVTQNVQLRQLDPEFPHSLIAFGDYGLGEPFCIDPESGSVVCWYPIEAVAWPISPDLHTFWRGLVEDTIEI